MLFVKSLPLHGGQGMILCFAVWGFIFWPCNRRFRRRRATLCPRREIYVHEPHEGMAIKLIATWLSHPRIKIIIMKKCAGWNCENFHSNSVVSRLLPFAAISPILSFPGHFDFFFNSFRLY